MAVVTTIGAQPARIDIELTAGEPVDFTVPVYNGTGAAQDTTGWIAAATVRTSRDATRSLYVFAPVAIAPTVVNGVTVDPGGVRIAAPSADTAEWTSWPASAPWDLWLTPPAGQRDILAAGWVRVRPAITH